MGKGVIQLIKRDYITKGKTLKELASEYNMSYASVKNISSKEKWKYDKKKYEELKKATETANNFIDGLKQVRKALADSLDTALILIGQMAQQPQEYFIHKDKISINKVKEFLGLIKMALDITERLYGGGSKYENDIAQLQKANYELKKELSGQSEGNVIEDGFIEMLEDIGKNFSNGKVLYDNCS